MILHEYILDEKQIKSYLEKYAILTDQQFFDIYNKIAKFTVERVFWVGRKWIKTYFPVGFKKKGMKYFHTILHNYDFKIQVELKDLVYKKLPLELSEEFNDYTDGLIESCLAEVAKDLVDKLKELNGNTNQIDKIIEKWEYK